MSRVLQIQLLEFNATSLTGSYQDFGAVLTYPAIKIVLFNTSDVDAYISRDGTNNYMRIPAYGTLTLDESTLYFRGCDQEYYFPKGTQLEIKQVTGAGTTGAIIAHIVERSMT